MGTVGPRHPEAFGLGTQGARVCSELHPVQSGLGGNLEPYKSRHSGAGNPTARTLQLDMSLSSLHLRGPRFTTTDLP